MQLVATVSSQNDECGHALTEHVAPAAAGRPPPQCKPPNANAHFDAVVGQLIAGDQHLSFLLFHSLLFVGICMRIQQLGYAQMPSGDGFVQGCPSPGISVKG